jgi:hypothetical protein
VSGQIFISYRREESRWSARIVRDRLCREFDPKQVFMDIDAIPLGEDFVELIENKVAECDVLIAVIGRNWLSCKDERGKRRLDNPLDFVRTEIASALKRRVRVIPILVDGAIMPLSQNLPDDLKPQARRNALIIGETSFDSDCERLAEAIREATEQRQREGAQAEQHEEEAKQRENKRLQIERREKERAETELQESQRLQGERLAKERQDDAEKLRALITAGLRRLDNSAPIMGLVGGGILTLVAIVSVRFMSAPAPTPKPTPVPSPTVLTTP